MSEPIQPQPGLVMIRPQYDQGEAGQPEKPENVTFWQATDVGVFPLSGTILEDIMQVFDPAWGAMWAVNGLSGQHYIGSIITDLSAPTGLQESSVGVFAPVNGGEPGPPCAADTSMLLSLPVINRPRYRGGHGRVYLPFQSATGINTPFAWKASALTATNTGYQNLVTAMAGIVADHGGAYTQMVYAFKRDPIKAKLYLVNAPNVIAQPAPATQRRRQRKVAHR